jgi:hypothetical protein
LNYWREPGAPGYFIAKIPGGSEVLRESSRLKQIIFKFIVFTKG